MKLITSISRDFLHFFNVRTRRGLIRTAVVVMLLVAGFIFLKPVPVDPNTTLDTRTMVKVGSVATLNLEDTFSIVGAVESQSQADILAEASGRVTTVPVQLGQQLVAGQVIATLENTAQNAALLQAQGSYDAAVAAAKQGELGVDQAGNSVQSALNAATIANQNAYTTANDLVLGSLDTFYSNGVSGIIGFRITTGQAGFYNGERMALRTVLPEWEEASAQTLTEGTIDAALAQAIANTTRINTLVSEFAALTTNASFNDMLGDQTVRSYTASLIANQTTLNGVLSSLRTAQTSYQNALKARQQAELAGTSDVSSAASAQVKIALGALRAAESAYAKTIVRAPISGTLNELSVKPGDYVTSFARVALVANNDALMVTAYVGEGDRDRIKLGQTVLLDGNIEGTIIAIAPAVDTVTRKTEVKIASESTAIKTGDTVTVAIEATRSSESEQIVRVPIQAVKFTASTATMFRVVDGALAPMPVQVGTVTGDTVVITEGIDAATKFVLDARGLTPGQLVEVIE